MLIASRFAKISSLARIAREWGFSNSVREKEYTEKAKLALWLVHARSQLPFHVVSKFLHLSTKRTLDTLRPLIDRGLIQLADDEGQQIVSITRVGLTKVDEFAEESAAWQRSLIGDLPLSAAELRALATFTEKVVERLDEQLKTWVLGRGL